MLTFEYEPTPRAFAVPLLICAIGLAAHRRYLAAGIAASVAFLYHPPTALPFWGVYFLLALWPGPLRRARLTAFVPLAAAVALLAAAARAQSASGDAQRIFARLDSGQEFLQRMRTAYVWVSSWPAATIVHHLLVLAVLSAAFVRIRKAVGVELRVLLLGLAALGLLTMPLSWLLLEQFHWGLVPQVQPMRALLFLTLGMQFFTAAAGARAIAARRPAEAFAWFALAYLLPLQPVLTGPFVWSRVGARVRPGSRHRARRNASRAPRRRCRLLRHPHVAAWSTTRTCTPPISPSFPPGRAPTRGATRYSFSPASGRNLAPGIFRSEALRAVYVDWKGGGQVNYLKDLGEQWWFRWRQVRDFHPADLPQYTASGISYVVLQEPLARASQFQNSTYVVYELK